MIHIYLLVYSAWTLFFPIMGWGMALLMRELILFVLLVFNHFEKLMVSWALRA